MKHKSLEEQMKDIAKKAKAGDVNTLKSIKSKSGKTLFDEQKSELETSCLELCSFLCERIKQYADQSGNYTLEEISAFRKAIKHEVKVTNGKLSARVYLDKIDSQELDKFFELSSTDARNSGKFKNLL